LIAADLADCAEKPEATARVSYWSCLVPPRNPRNP
jgi:hypothetical protein